MQETNLPRPTDSMIGKLLVAATTVQDPVLTRSVSLVVHQDTKNIYAVLLNRPMTPPPELVKMLTSTGPVAAPRSGRSRIGSQPSETQPSDSPDLEQADSKHTDPKQADPKHVIAAQTAADASNSLGTIHFGGPLSGPVVAVHNSSAHAESQAGRGVYVAAQRDMLETLVKQKPGSFRLIVGHLGWSIPQLCAEREAGLWHIIDATDEDVFAGDQDIWPKVIRRATTGSLAAWLGIKASPVAAELN